MKDRETAPDWVRILNGPEFFELAGDIVRAIEPHSEADPFGLLLQFLIAFGSAVGHEPHFLAEEDRHAFNLYGVLVGQTSRARKGSSWGQVRRFFAEADPEWVSKHIVSGLSSGEGLIHRVRDPREADAGTKDKRLLVVETELGSALRVLARTGNTLSPTLRDAWDSGNLEVLSKHTAAKATAAHISLIGHITHDELSRHFSGAEVFSGLANRILWLSVRRCKSLPTPGRLPDAEFQALVGRLKDAIKFAQECGQLILTDKAARKWEQIYESLGEEAPGLFGAAVSRAEPQVLRLAGIYALADQSKRIKRAHLNAAVSLWRICRASAQSVFSAATPLRRNVHMERLIDILRTHPDGISRTELSAAFGHHVSAADLDKALTTWERHGKVRRVRKKTAGRPAEYWQLTGEERVND